MSTHSAGFCKSYVVNAVTDKHETVSHKMLKVKKGKKATFVVVAKKGYIFSKLVAGTCPKGSWKKNRYTTGKIKKKCTAYFSAGRVGSRKVVVSPSGDSKVTISPNKSEKIITGSLAQFKVTPKNSGDEVSRTVGGTCPKGVWLEKIYYKLGPIYKSCTVSFSGTASGGGGNFVPHYTLIAGDINNGSGYSDGQGSYASFAYLRGISKQYAGNFYVADTSNHTIRKIDTDGNVTTLAGLGQNSGATDGQGTNALFNAPGAVAVDSTGNVYVSDSGNNTIRKIDTNANVTTIAGSVGQSGSTDGLTTSARFSNPNGIAVDSLNNIYVADSDNNTIRKIDTNGNVTTIAGSAGQSGSTDATGTNALF